MYLYLFQKTTPGPAEGSLVKAKTKSRPHRQNDDGNRDFDSRATKDILDLALLQQEHRGSETSRPAPCSLIVFA